MGREGQQMRSEQTKRAIMDTALQIGMEEGFEAVSIRKIIDRLDYSIGVVYHHFQNKQEIIDAIQEDANEDIYERITKVYNPKEDFFENTKSIFHVIMLLALEEREKFNLIVLDKYTKRNESNKRWIDMMIVSIQEAMDKGKIVKDDPQMLAFVIWSSFLGFNFMISKETITKEEAEILFQKQCDLIFYGLKI